MRLLLVLQLLSSKIELQLLAKTIVAIDMAAVAQFVNIFFGFMTGLYYMSVDFSEVVSFKDICCSHGCA